MSTAILHAVDVAKSYGEGAVRHAALRGITVDIEKGEFVAIRGPSGCGKSTLLHIFGAMDRPTSGEVLLNAQHLDTMTLEQLAVVRRRHIGFVFQSFNLLPTLSVEENVALPLLLDSVPEQETQVRSDKALADVGMQDRAKHLPSQLSGGEMQRAAIARALAIDPQLIIADEPTGSLDSVNGQRVLQLLAKLNGSKGLTVLMATHSEEASAYASRILHLRDGRLDEEVGTDVFPATL